MGIIDHFEAVDDPGFRSSVDPNAARQQFNMSLGLVVVLAIAAATLALSFRFEPHILEAQVKAPIRLVVQAPQHAELQQAAR
jgi:hypothetical protein